MFGHFSTGAADDLAKATDIARSMVTRYGMGGELGPVTYESEPDGFLGQVTGTRRLYSEATAREIDVAVREVVEARSSAPARSSPRTARSSRSPPGSCSRKETLAGDELAAVLGRVSREHPHVAAAAPV